VFPIAIQLSYGLTIVASLKAIIYCENHLSVCFLLVEWAIAVIEILIAL
jgi:hypothetical protein